MHQGWGFSGELAVELKSEIWCLQIQESLRPYCHPGMRFKVFGFHIVPDHSTLSIRRKMRLKYWFLNRVFWVWGAENSLLSQIFGSPIHHHWQKGIGSILNRMADALFNGFCIVLLSDLRVESLRLGVWYQMFTLIYAKPANSFLNFIIL